MRAAENGNRVRARECEVDEKRGVESESINGVFSICTFLERIRVENSVREAKFLAFGKIFKCLKCLSVSSPHNAAVECL